MASILYRRNDVVIDGDKTEINSNTAINGNVNIKSGDRSFFLSDSGIDFSYIDKDEYRRAYTVEKFDAETIGETGSNDANEILRRSIPSSFAVRQLFKAMDVTPFKFEVDDGAVPTLSIVLNSDETSGLSLNFEYHYGLDESNNAYGYIVTKQDISKFTLSETTLRLLQIANTRKFVKFIDYVNNSVIQYTDTVHGLQTRLTIPNKFIGKKVGDVIQINDLPVESWTTDTISKSDIIEKNNGIMRYYYIDQTGIEKTLEADEIYVSLVFTYKPILRIDSKYTNYISENQSILANFLQYSWPMELDLSETILGPNCTALMKNDYSKGSLNTFMLDQKAIYSIKNITIDNNQPTYLQGFMRNLWPYETTFSHTLDVSKCVTFGGFNQCRGYTTLYDLYTSTGMSDWVCDATKELDFHYFVAFCGATEYRKPGYEGSRNTPDSLKPMITYPTERTLDFSNLSQNGPIHGILYAFFAYSQCYGKLIIPRMKTIEYPELNQIFCENLFTEITDLNNVDVSNVTNLNDAFNNAIFLREIDISTWNMDNVKKATNMFTNLPSLTKLKINKRYVLNYESVTATSSPVTPTENQQNIAITTPSLLAAPQNMYAIAINHSRSTGLFSYTGNNTNRVVTSYECDANGILTLNIQGLFNEIN